MPLDLDEVDAAGELDEQGRCGHSVVALILPSRVCPGCRPGRPLCPLVLESGRNREHEMGSLGLPEILVILLIVILIFGASRLPEIGRGIGKGIRNFKESLRDGRDDQ